MILAYLMQSEHKERMAIREADFDNMVFANDPELYKALKKTKAVDEESVEWQRPQTEGDVQRMMEEMRKMGAFDS